MTSCAQLGEAVFQRIYTQIIKNHYSSIKLIFNHSFDTHWHCTFSAIQNHEGLLQKLYVKCIYMVHPALALNETVVLNETKTHNLDWMYIIINAELYQFTRIVMMVVPNPAVWSPMAWPQLCALRLCLCIVFYYFCHNINIIITMIYCIVNAVTLHLH